MSTAHGIETEVKIRLSSAPAAQRLLADAGFTISVPRGFEANTLYDTADLKLRNTEMLLRLRQFGEKSVVTWKGPSVPGPHKMRPELETSVGSSEAFDQILRALGYQPIFRYEKYRAEYKQQGAASDGVVSLDETPIGDFLELEGAPDWIDRTAALLGFERGAYVLASYGRLYLDHCAAQGVEPGNMVFPQSSFVH
jgi:adenylate cyclase class 2